MRALFDEFRHHFAVAAGRYGERDTDGFRDSVTEGRIVGWQVVAAITAVPENRNLPPEEVFRYIKNVAQQEMVGHLAEEDRIILSEMAVRFPPGRPPTHRPKARQRLIDELRAKPQTSDWRIEARARELGLWSEDQADDQASRRKRIRRLREDAAK